MESRTQGRALITIPFLASGSRPNPPYVGSGCSWDMSPLSWGSCHDNCQTTQSGDCGLWQVVRSGTGEGNKGALVLAETWGREGADSSWVRRKATVQGHIQVSYILPSSGPWNFSTSQAHLSSETQASNGEEVDSASCVLCHQWSRDWPHALHQELRLSGMVQLIGPAQS